MRSIISIITCIAVLPSVLLVGGCNPALAQADSIEITGLIIRNDTSGPVNEVRLKVEKTGSLVTCNFILPGHAFSTEFPLRRYQGNSVNISWQQNGRTFTTGEMYAQVSSTLDLKLPAMAVVILRDGGRAAVRLEQ